MTRASVLCFLWSAAIAAAQEQEAPPPPWPPQEHSESQPAAEVAPAGAEVAPSTAGAEVAPVGTAPVGTAPVGTALAGEPEPAPRPLPSLMFFPGLRVSGGAVVVVTPTDVRVDGALDLQAGLRIILSPSPGGIVVFDTSLGYTLQSGLSGGHAFTVGGSALFGSPVAALGPSVFLLLGQLGERFAPGVRASVRTDFFMGLLGVEIGYEGRFADALTAHELRLMITTEGLGMLLAAAFGG